MQSVRRKHLSWLPAVLITLRLALGVLLLAVGILFTEITMAYVLCAILGLNFVTFFVNIKMKRLTIAELKVDKISQIVLHMLWACVLLLHRFYLIWGVMVYILVLIVQARLTIELIKISPKKEYKDGWSFALQNVAEVLCIILLFYATSVTISYIFIGAIILCVMGMNLIKTKYLLKAAQALDVILEKQAQPTSEVPPKEKETP